MYDKKLLEILPVPVFYKARDGKYLDCNEAFLSFVSRSREEVIGFTVYDMASKEIADIYKQKDDELFSNPGRQVYNWKVESKNGEIKYVIFYKATFSDAQGVVQGLIGVILDVTAQTVADDEIRTRNKILKTFNDIAVDREMRMIELKKKINDLSLQLGLPEPYK